MNPQTINPRVAAVNAEIARQGNKGFSVAPSAPTYVPPNEPIDASALGNVKPINIPEKPIPTSAAGLSGVSQGVVEQTRMAQKLEQDKMQAETAKESKQSSLEDTFKEYLGIVQSVGQMEKEAGIDTKAQKATDVTNQIEALSRAKQNEIRALEQQPGTMAQKAQRQADIERQYAFQEADLALIQSAANRDLLTAQSILQRKIDLQLEVLGKQLEFEKFMYNENKEIFTKAEERQFQNMIKDDERAYSQEKQRVETLEKIKLQLLMSASEQGAPSSVLQAIQSAKEPQSAIVSAGQYGADILERQIKQAQLAKLQTDAATAIAKLGEAPEGTGPVAQAQAKGNIDLISGLASDKYLSSAVGPNTFARTSLFNAFTGGKSNFIAGVEQLSSQLSLDSLIRAKANGATFGALSDSELKILSASASKLGTWAIKDKNGNVIGYKTSEAEFKKEMDKINNFAKLDYLIKGGSAEDVGAQQLADGTIWVANSDGSFTQLYP